MLTDLVLHTVLLEPAGPVFWKGLVHFPCKGAIRQIAIKDEVKEVFSVNELHALVDGNVVPQPFETKEKQSSL